MSSLVRRIQIRALQRQGFVRTKTKPFTRPDGKVELRPVRKGGVILNPDGREIGYRWPRAVGPALA